MTAKPEIPLVILTLLSFCLVPSFPVNAGPLRDKLFVAVGRAVDGTPVVEFQSWNPLNKTGAFDFGSYEGRATPHLDPIDKCIKCHLNYGPGIPVGGWTHWIHEQNPSQNQNRTSLGLA
jgi:hypothetical protein